MISRIKTFLTIFRHLWAARRDGTGSRADAAQRTSQMMSDLGLGEDSGGAYVALDDATLEYLENPPWDDMFPHPAGDPAVYLPFFRAARLTWNGAESGAPQLDPRQPYAGTTALELLAQAGLIGDDMAKARHLAALTGAIAQFIRTAELTPGTYTIANIAPAEARRALPDRVDGGFDGGMNVTVTEDDVALLRGQQWEWEPEDIETSFENGDIAGPSVDPKRPYGDMTHYPLDVHRLLGWPTEQKTDAGFIALTDAQDAEAQRLHLRSLAVTQAFFEHAILPKGAAT
ncbi:MAG: hypothetical protein AAF218_01495 [Pseudomonadota bacterium]